MKTLLITLIALGMLIACTEPTTTKDIQNTPPAYEYGYLGVMGLKYGMTQPEIIVALTARNLRYERQMPEGLIIRPDTIYGLHCRSFRPHFKNDSFAGGMAFFTHDRKADLLPLFDSLKYYYGEPINTENQMFDWEFKAQDHIVSIRLVTMGERESDISFSIKPSP